MTTAEIMAALAAPFPAADIEWRVGSTNAEKTRGLALAYLTSRAVQQRLDDAVGPANWTNEFVPWGDKGVLCTLSLRLDGAWIAKADGAEQTDIEPVKGGFSDALKRAAVLWGVGRYLYHLDAQWCEIETHGRSSKIKQEPRLPAWALPGGSGRPSAAPMAAGGGKPSPKPAAPSPASDLAAEAARVFGGEIVPEDEQEAWETMNKDRLDKTTEVPPFSKTWTCARCGGAMFPKPGLFECSKCGFTLPAAKSPTKPAPEPTTEPVCPRCGKPTKLRNGKKGQFWGCTGYPECKGTLNHSPALPAEDALPGPAVPHDDDPLTDDQQAEIANLWGGDAHKVLLDTILGVAPGQGRISNLTVAQAAKLIRRMQG